MNTGKKILDGMTILSTDPDSRIGVYSIRYLGRAGAKVDVIGSRGIDKDPIGFYSKYINRKICFNPNDFDCQFSDFLASKGECYDLINPINVSKMLLLMQQNESLNLNLRYLLPSVEHLQIADNKEKIVAHAEKVGVACPRTFSRVRVADLENPDKLGITFPCIIKFRGDDRITHWRPEERYRIVRDSKKLLSEYLEMHSIEEFPIIQEYIEGTGVGYFALYDRNRRLKAQFCHQRIREYPTTGGPSSCCMGIYDEKLVKIGRTLLESLDWMGLAMVEFKYDRNRNKFYLLEINPRYWGSLPLAVNSGVNFPVLHALAASGVDFEPVLKYSSGVVTRFIDKDLKAIMSLLRTKLELKRKLGLVGSLLNPTIKEGFFTLDDIGMFYRFLRAIPSLNVLP